ncbi:NAD(+)/NADH kinase [Candidatus Woesearchaeota archaeon]|nr:NAD(+)/NADH kinase [Candidatus Woesearchaeota archaeon]
MKPGKTLVVYTTPRTNEQKLTLKIIRNVLKKYKISHKFANRDRLRKVQFKSRNFIIAVGGDGTFLRAAQFIDNQLLFGVNADAKNKEGFFMKADKNSFKKKIIKIIKGKAKIKKLSRLEARINGKKVESLALNEFFIGTRKSYHAAKYVIKIGGKRERQKSSGILVTTPTGSYAWAKSCCRRVLPLNSNEYQFVVREPYEGKIFRDYKLKYGILSPNQKIIIISEMLDGVLVADSVSKEYEFKNGSNAVIKSSNNHINAIWE